MHKKMEEGRKNKWVAALRSEKYKQARGVLLDYDDMMPELTVKNCKFCCLAVGAHALGMPFERLRYEYSNGAGFFLGLSDETISELVTLNDGREYNFHQIANWIEVNL